MRSDRFVSGAVVGIPGLALIFGLAGCGGIEDGLNDGPAQQRAALVTGVQAVPIVPTDVTPGDEEVCSRKRWVGLKPANAAHCPGTPPTVGGQWSVGPLFEVGNQANPQARRLAAYCAYEWTGQADPADNAVRALTGLADQGALVDLDRDCAINVPFSGTNSCAGDAVWRDLERSFHDQVDRVVPIPGDFGAGRATPAQVRVAIADSTPGAPTAGRADAGQLEHGLAMGRIVRQLTCPFDQPAYNGNARCIGQVANHLALPREGTGQLNTAAGGFYGYISEVGTAVNASVRRWTEHRAVASGATEQRNLVINLSVGWDADRSWSGAGQPPFESDVPRIDMPLAVRATFDAIAHAHCAGAVIVGAAGNDTGGPNPGTGMVYPAGWNAVNARAINCDVDYEVEPEHPSSLGAYPLVYAASGLDYADDLLDNTRLGGVAQLAATAFHVSAGWDSDGDHVVDSGTPVYTGTSVAAAALSSAAALVWGYEPTMPAPEAMEIVRKAALPLGHPADVCVGGSCGNARRVSLCRTVAEVCSLGTATSLCPAKGFTYGDCGPPPTPTAGPTPALPTAACEAAATTVVSENAATWGLAHAGRVPVCHHVDTSAPGGTVSRFPCPFRQKHSTLVTPSVNPQPTDPACPTCMFDANPYGSSSLWVEVSSSYKGYSMQNATLTVNGRDVSLKLGTLTGGDIVKVTGLGAYSSYSKASVSFTVGGKSVSNAILVY